MIIGVDVSRAFRKQKTGVEWYAYYLMHALHAKDTANEYRFYSDVEPPLSLDPSLRSKIKILRWPFAYAWTQGALSLEMLLHPPDALLITASAMPLVHPRATIVVVHDVGFLEYPDYRKCLEMRYVRWSTEYALRHALRIITVSEWTKKEIGTYYHVPADRISVARIGINQQYYHPISQSVSAETLSRFAIRQPFFLYIGRLDPRKNIITLINSFSLIAKDRPAYSLVLAGPKGYGAQDILNAMHDAHDKGASIHYLSWISEEDKRALLSACEAFIYPSYYEGFGIPVIEAQLCRAPVIASAIPALAETSGGAACFFNPHNVKTLVRAMLCITNDRIYRVHLQQKGVINAQRFSWESCASIINDVCRQAAMRND